jgi:hypothetical protein
LKPAAWSSEIAWSSDSPITVGTVIGASPLETLIRTGVPFTTRLFGAGSCAMTVPWDALEWM